MAKAKKEKPVAAKKAVKPAPSQEQVRKTEEFVSYVLGVVQRSVPERMDVKTRKRWKSVAGRLILERELKRIFSNLDLSIEEMERVLYPPAEKNILEYAPGGKNIEEIFPEEINLGAIELEEPSKTVAGGAFQSEEEQRKFFDAGPADGHWSGEKKQEDAEPARELMPGLISNAQEDAVMDVPALEAVEESPTEDIETLPTDPFADLMKEWEGFYHDVFKEEIEGGSVSLGDFINVKCPVRKSGLLQLIAVAKGITPLILYKKCMKYFPCYSRRLEDYNFVWLIVSERNSDARSYAIWTDRRLNSDKELVGISPGRLRANDIPTMTFEERCLHDLFRFYQDAKEKGVALGEYDMKNFAKVAGVGFQFDEATLCAGSKVNDPEKKKGNAVLYMWVNRVFAIKVWEPKDWPLGVDQREAEQRYLQNMRAHRVSVEVVD